MTCLLRTSLRLSFVTLVVVGLFCPALLGQGPSPDAPVPATQPVPTTLFTSRGLAAEHKFWDKENRILFAASGAFSAADFAATRANLQRGGRDLNPVVRFFGPSTAGLAVNFAGETLGVIGVSYFFHRTGHHKIERFVTMVNIGSSAGAVSYDLAIR